MSDLPVFQCPECNPWIIPVGMYQHGYNAAKRRLGPIWFLAGALCASLLIVALLWR